MVHRRSWILALLFVLTGCSAPAASSSGTPAPASGEGPTATPTASSTPRPSATPLAGALVTDHAMACTYRGAPSCEIEAFDEAGAVVDGWPITLTGECHDLVTRHDGSAVVVCDDEQVGVVHAIRSDGTAAPGWPVTLPHRSAMVSWNTFGISCGESLPSLAVAADDTVFVASAGIGAAQLHALGPDGTPLAGWPRPFPGDAPVQDWGDGCRGFTLGPGGSVVAWGYEGEVPDIYLTAGRTVFTVSEADGTVRSGWPRGSVGAASGPIVAEDGSLSYVTAAGNAWRHDAAGEPVDGWPFALGEPLRPYPASDGRLAFIREGDVAEAIMIDANGASMAGWPIIFDSAIQSRCLFGDTPCVGIVDPAFAPDGTMFVALDDDPSTDGGAIAMIGPDGRMVPGWPYALGDHAYAVGLTIDAQGRLLVDAVTCVGSSCPPDWEPSTLVFDTNEASVVETLPASSQSPE